MTDKELIRYWQRGYIRDKAHHNQVTLREVLMREWELVQIARVGVAAMHPLVKKPSLLSFHYFEGFNLAALYFIEAPHDKNGC